VASLLSAVVFVAAAHAGTFTVDSTVDVGDAMPGDGVCATAAATCTLRAAIEEANEHDDSDVVTVPAGSYELSLGVIECRGGLEINGAGAETTIIDGLHQGRVLHLFSRGPSPFAIRDVTIRGGLLSNVVVPGLPANNMGAGMLVQSEGPCTVERVTFRDNACPAGGGLAAINEGSLTIIGSTFDDNTATGTGGLGSPLATGGAALTVQPFRFDWHPVVSIADSTFTGNVAESLTANPFENAGGTALIAQPGALDVTNTTFTNNDGGTGSSGLAVLQNASPLTLTGCTFDGNSSKLGAALYVAVGLGAVAVGGPVSITDTTITNNVSSNEGAVAPSCAGGAVFGETVTISGGDVSDNDGACGLSVLANAGVTIDGTTFRRNQGGMLGGGLSATIGSGTLSLTNVEASENSGHAGGGIALTNVGPGDIALTKLRVLDNSSVQAAGGLAATALSTGGITLVDSTIAGNVTGGFGGGVVLDAGSALSIQGTTIAQNHTVGGSGGGGVVNADTTFAITNSTISGNLADGDSTVGGGGLAVVGTGTIRNVTFVGNDAPTASALLSNAPELTAMFSNAGTATVVSSIIAGSAANHCGATALLSGGNNLDSNGSCAFAAPGDQNDVDPELGPLADNGGPTLTHLPASNSPVVDHGAVAGCPGTDQRGETRPKDGDGGGPVCDVGAVEAAMDLCPNDPLKVEPGACGCDVVDDAIMANGTPDCFINGELRARIARAKAIIGELSGDQDPSEAELNEIGGSFKPYLTQFDGQIVLNGKTKKVLRLARKASKAVAKVTKAKAGKKLDKAKKPALRALDKLDATIAPQA